jgi:hypothetical protein
MEYLPVTVDKSHLITIGERLYSESIELIRELVNNAYDADATQVDIKMTNELIEVKDNGAGMDREGLKQYFIASRIRGEVHADFLPVTTDRSGFVVDTPPYQAFRRIMDKVTQEVDDILKRLAGRKEKRKASKALKEALQRVRRALALNPDLSPFGAIPLAGEGEGMGGAGAVSKKLESLKEEKEGQLEEGEAAEETQLPPQPKKTRKKSPKVKRLTPNAIVQRMRFAETGVSVCVDDFGEDGPECFTEGTVIYINQQHPLYQREVKKPETCILNVTRLITQEISLMKDTRNPRQAFSRQSKLLRDAFIENAPH